MPGMFDLTRETRLSAREACRHPLTRRGSRPLSRSVLERWWTHGVRSTSGDRVVLESCRLGGLRFTTAEAIERFFARLNGADATKPTGTDLRRQHNAAERELDVAGL